MAQFDPPRIFAAQTGQRGQHARGKKDKEVQHSAEFHCPGNKEEKKWREYSREILEYSLCQYGKIKCIDELIRY